MNKHKLSGNTFKRKYIGAIITNTRINLQDRIAKYNLKSGNKDFIV